MHLFGNQRNAPAGKETEAESGGGQLVKAPAAGAREWVDRGRTSSGPRHPPRPSGSSLKTREGLSRFSRSSPSSPFSVFTPLASKSRKFHEKQAHTERSYPCHHIGSSPHQASEV